MRALAAAACLLACSGAGAVAGSNGSANLSITAWPRGTTGPVGHWTLRCGPVSGTVPRAAEACRTLAATPNWWVPVPKEAICTLIYGGSQLARVAGTFAGRKIWVRFRRTNGCEIARWNRVGVLFPIPIGAS
jgi:hypothetical protein